MLLLITEEARLWTIGLLLVSAVVLLLSAQLPGVRLPPPHEPGYTVEHPWERVFYTYQADRISAGSPPASFFTAHGYVLLPVSVGSGAGVPSDLGR